MLVILTFINRYIETTSSYVTKDAATHHQLDSTTASSVNVFVYQ